MLVHYVEPYGVLHFNGYRIYGRWTGRPPIDIPALMYSKYNDLFTDGTYHVGDIAFRVSELKCLPMPTVSKIASRMGLMKFHGGSKKHEIINRIRKALRDGSPALPTSTGT